MTAQAAFTQAGYNAKQNAPRLRNNEIVAKRIEELQTRNERKAEKAALSRDELIDYSGGDCPRSPESFVRDSHSRRA